MAALVALAGALIGAQLAQASPVYGANATTPGVVYTTEVVESYTTYCPGATTLTYNDKTYTVTEATTLTITDCPCTVTKPVKPTYTSAPPPPPAVTTPGGGVHYTTEVVTELTTYCPSPTTLTYNNVTYTVTKPTTLTVTNCPCSITKPIVYTTEVVTKLTTYCPSPTTLTYNNVTYTVTEPTSLTVTNCPCTITKATTIPSGTAPSKPETTVPAKTCAEMCYDSYNSCRSQPDANHASCAAEFAGCLGYSPFDESGSLVTPTACSSGATGATVPATVPPAAGTTAATVPGSAATTPASVPTAAAGRALPEYILLALGAFALL